MERDANTEALNRYLDQQEQEEIEYEQMMEELKYADPDDYENIIISYNYGTEDIADIIKDI